jgi:hypothetical protein
MMKRIYVVLRVWLAVVVLTACGSTTTVTNSDGTVSTTNRAPAVIATPDLPGRLLMAKAGEVGWNFTKFLVSKDGAVVTKFEADVEPQGSALETAIEAALK